MIEQCPHCSRALRFSPAHREKLAQALENLSPGRSLKFTCPKCKTPIELDSSGQPLGNGREQGPGPERASSQPVSPPGAPDISWLAGSETGEEEIPEDVPTAMVLVDDPGLKEKVKAGLEENQYQIVVPERVEDAMESMRFKSYEVVVFFTGYGGRSFEDQAFHRFMMKMNMKKRRHMFYILVGPEFDTLYDLQALTFSANLVVNPAQISHFATLIKKGLRAYEDLFGPYVSSLKRHGKN